MRNKISDKINTGIVSYIVFVVLPHLFCSKTPLDKSNGCEALNTVYQCRYLAIENIKICDKALAEAIKLLIKAEKIEAKIRTINKTINLKITL